MKLGTLLKRIVRLDPDTYRIELEYQDGFRGIVDLGFLFGAPKRKPKVMEIRRGNLFAKCFVESGALVWPNGYELCPDALRLWIASASKKVA